MKKDQIDNDIIGEIAIPVSIYEAITLIGEHYTLLRFVREAHLYGKHQKMYSIFQTFCDENETWDNPKRRAQDLTFMRLCDIMGQIKETISDSGLP